MEQKNIEQLLQQHRKQRQEVIPEENFDFDPEYPYRIILRGRPWWQAANLEKGQFVLDPKENRGFKVPIQQHLVSKCLDLRNAEQRLQFEEIIKQPDRKAA